MLKTETYCSASNVSFLLSFGIPDYYAYGSPLPMRRNLVQCSVVSTYDTAIAYTKNEDFNSGGTGGFTANTGTVSNPTGNQLHMTANWASKPLATTSVYLVNGRTYTLNLDIVGFSVVSGFSHTVRVRVVLPGAAFNTDFTTTGTKTITFTSNTTGYVNIEIRSIISPPTGVYSGNPYIDIDNFKVSWDSAFTSSDTICVSKSGYRYGFNGMEKDFGLSENGDVYTAEFWEYDARLGRRWNIDPVYKVFQSNYSTFRSNPIIYIDPNGDDEYFNADGTYSHKDNRNTNYIWIMGPDNNYVLLSKFPVNTLALRMVIAKVIAHYAGKVGISGLVGVRWHVGKNSSDVPAFTVGDIIYINLTGYINPLLNNIDNLKNTLVHEKDHKAKKHGFINNSKPDENKNDPTMHSQIWHINVYIVQIQDPTFKNTTKPFKKGVASAIGKFIKEELEYQSDNGPGIENDVFGLLDIVNVELAKYGLKIKVEMTDEGIGSKKKKYKYEVINIEKKKKKKKK